MNYKKILCVFFAIMLIIPVCFLPTLAKEVGEDDVSREGDFSYIILDGNAVLVGYSGAGGDLVLPETLGGYSLVGVRKNVFIEDNNITSVHIPASLTDITAEQFCLCQNIKAVTVAEGNPTYISIDGVLYEDGGKTLRYHPPAHSEEYNIPETVTKIAPYAFFTNKELAAVTIPSSVTEIGANAFYDCQILREVYIPDSVVKVGANAFSWCINLKELRVPDKLSDMGRSAFFPCYIVTHSEEEFVTLGDNVLVAYLGESINIEIPEGVKKIGDVFFTNENIESVKIPSSVEDISDYAFYGCKRLKSVKFPKGLKRVGEWAFFGCEKLKSVDVPSGAKVEEYAFAGCVKLQEASVNTKTVSAYAFANCDKLEKVTLGSKVKKIGDYAFYACASLKSVKLPSKLESIGVGAFRGVGLKKLTLGTTITKIGRAAFIESPVLVLTVTKGSYAYEYVSDNKLEFKLKMTEDNQVATVEKEGFAGFVETVLEDYLVFVIAGGAALLLIVILLAILLVVRKKRRKRKAQAALAEENGDAQASQSEELAAKAE